MDMRTLVVTVRGLPPGLLMCSTKGFVQAAVAELDGDEKRPMAKKAKKLTTVEQAKLHLYEMENGALAFKSAAFARVIQSVAAARLVKPPEGGRMKKLLNVLGAVWDIEPKPFVPLMRNGKPIKKYEVDVRDALNWNARPPARIIVSRPLVVTPWETTFHIIYPEGMIRVADPAGTFKMLLEDGGWSVGIGAYRPERKGWFGRFELVDIAEV